MTCRSYFSETCRSRSPYALLLLCSSALLTGCGTAEKEPEPVVAVQVVAAKRAPIEETVSSNAVIFPLQQAVIAPKITSTIRKFYVQRGSQVKQGQLLAELENADLASTAEQSKGEYEQAEANYSTTTEAGLPQQIQKAKLDAESAQAAYDAQKKVYEARKGLFAQGAIPRRDLDTAEVALVQARSQNEQAQKQLADLNRVVEAQQLKSVSGQLSAAKGKYLNAQAQLSYSEIRSPIDGVITDRPLYQGELATANQPILTVMNTSKLIAKAHIAQSEAVELKVGDAAELRVPGVDDPIKGKVTLISPALDPGSTTIEVWIEVSKPSAALKPGMSVSIDAVAKSAKDALVVPRSAVFKAPEGEDYVMLAASDGKAHQANVKVGIRSKDFVEITSGVNEGSSVITVGGYALPDNTKITIESAPPTESATEKNSADKDKSETAAKGKGSAPAKEKE
jgi:multidrug efflux pump subunit AcrA (membrane-fusion protein)